VRRDGMPVYNLFCMLRPTVGQGQLAGFMKKLGTAVFRNGGVLMDIRHHGLAKTAYMIKRPGLRMTQGQMFQMSFNVPSEALADVKYELRVEQDLVRWMVTKHDTVAFPIPGRIQMGDILRMMKEEVGTSDAVAGATDPSEAALAGARAERGA